MTQIALLDPTGLSIAPANAKEPSDPEVQNLRYRYGLGLTAPRSVTAFEGRHLFNGR